MASFGNLVRSRGLLPISSSIPVSRPGIGAGAGAREVLCALDSRAANFREAGEFPERSRAAWREGDEHLSSSDHCASSILAYVAMASSASEHSPGVF